MTRKSYVTLDDIAKTLNVSKVTASKALRGHPDISEETRRLVKKAALELGYTPNFAARNLSSKRSSTIGVIIPKIAHSFFGSVVEAIYDAAFDNNYDIALTVSQENAEREQRHVETLLGMGVDGIIVSVSQDTKGGAIFQKVLKRKVPLVFIDRVLDIKGTSQVTVDDKGGAFKAVELAIKNGNTKIAHFAGYKNISIGWNRYLGFEDAMRQYKIPVNPKWVIFGGFSEDYGYEGIMKLYRERLLPEFVFAVTYPVALGIYDAVTELGMKIPDDLDVICFGTSNVSRFIKPELSYVQQPTALLGKTAVDLILEQIRKGDERADQSIQLPTELILRDTCIVRKGRARSR